MGSTPPKISIRQPSNTAKSCRGAFQERIFSKTWQFAGFIEDVKDPGDYVTVQAGLNNILVVRGRDQRLRAFHNMCRHRGTQLLRAVGKMQKAIYGWTGTFTMTMGYRVRGTTTVPQGLTQKHVEASRYAVFNVAGQDIDSILTTWAETENTDLDRAYSTGYERYILDGQTISSATVWLAVK